MRQSIRGALIPEYEGSYRVKFGGKIQMPRIETTLIKRQLHHNLTVRPRANMVLVTLAMSFFSDKSLV